MFKKILFVSFFLTALFGGDAGGGAHLSAEDFNLFWLIPFIGILLSIALLPLINSKFWHRNYGKVSAFWGILFILCFSISFFDYTLFYILEVYLREFIPFIVWTDLLKAKLKTAKNSNELIAGPTIVWIPTFRNLKTSFLNNDQIDR